MEGVVVGGLGLWEVQERILVSQAHIWMMAVVLEHEKIYRQYIHVQLRG